MVDSSAPARSSAATNNNARNPVTPEAAHDTPLNGTRGSPGVNPALAALCAIARYHQVAADPATLAHQLGLSASEASATDDLLRAAKHLGLKAKLTYLFGRGEGQDTLVDADATAGVQDALHLWQRHHRRTNLAASVGQQPGLM